MRLLACAFSLLLASYARSAIITGTDYGGAALTPSNGDELSGTFTNVGQFTVSAGQTVFVAPGATLVVYASTITIAGTLDGSGAGQGGGGGGATGASGSIGIGANPAGTRTTAAGGGGAGAASKGGGGGGAGGAGGNGAGDSGGGVGASGGAAYGSTGTVTVPLSVDDLLQGSGGGGGGGSAGVTGGTGGQGGGAIYLEANAMTLTGAIVASGVDAPAVSDGVAPPHPGAGGGGGGGTVLLRVPGALNLSSGSNIKANGGRGGNVLSPTFCGLLDPGGGGAGGRIKLFGGPGATYSVILSTAGGVAGGTGGFCSTNNIDVSTPPFAGSTGTVSFGTVASAPTNFAAQGVYVTSISWTWSASAAGDGPSVNQYRIFPATATAPLLAPESTVAASVTGSTVTSLTPNTTYYRLVTHYTDWGDSLASNSISTHTLADVPSAAAAPFGSAADTSLTVSWTAGAAGNPSYTTYEIDRSTSALFAAPVSTGFIVGLSSSPTGLSPNTTYYFRVRAVNLDGVPSAFAATLSTATLGSVPGGPAASAVFITSVTFSWTTGSNPAGTLYLAQISTDNFATINASSTTAANTATFAGLDPGQPYWLRAAAINSDGALSAFSAAVSTTPGTNLGNASPPLAPSAPVANERFSYDGKATFTWAPVANAVDYQLILGSFPGGDDVIAASPATRATGTSFSATGLTSGRSYYAEVAARSGAGVTGPFSPSSSGVAVFLTTGGSLIDQPYNWPNPFNPGQGPTQIGFSLGAPASVELKIYTLQGELVRSQSFSFGSAGNQVATWDGSNGSGSRVAPGGYIAVLRKDYGDHSETQKLKIAVLY